ncbi:MAG: SUF system NifU family Fe-S cluster assembly protein [Pseudomonadota bacterium]|nr:SUF system NifU family Fe-S cluster assembly protein [Pseudomonadota bacterium]
MTQHLYQQMIIDHSKNPKGFCKNPQGSCEHGTNPMCGDEIQFCCEVQDGVITKMEYHASGCSISVAAASVLVATMSNMPVAEFDTAMTNYLSMLQGKDYETLPKKLEVFSGVCQYPMRVKCASFAWHAAKAAIKQAQHPIVISEEAKNYWQALVAKEQAQGVLLDFKKIGCMGWQFVPSLIHETPKDCQQLSYSSLEVFIPLSVIDTIRGTTVSFEPTTMGEGKVTFNHPDAQAHCGCGESFFLEKKQAVASEEVGSQV